MGVDVDESGKQGLAVGAHDPGARRNPDVGAHRIDPAVADDHRAAIGILSGGVENRRTGDRDQVATRGCARRLTGKADTDGDRRSRNQHLPNCGHAYLLVVDHHLALL